MQKNSGNAGVKIRLNEARGRELGRASFYTENRHERNRTVPEGAVLIGEDGTGGFSEASRVYNQMPGAIIRGREERTWLKSNRFMRSPMAGPLTGT
jgi:hypothetical protein